MPRLVTPPPAPQTKILRNNQTEANVMSIRRIPWYLLSEARKLHLMLQARDGRNIYAWCQWEPPEYIVMWWLWDGATWNAVTQQYGKKMYLGREV
jgi:hypothetical protein